MNRTLSLLLFAAGCAAPPAPPAGPPAKPACYFFLGTDCPIANAYVPEMRRIRADYPAVHFVAVYAVRDVSHDALKKHWDEHGFDPFAWALEIDGDLKAARHLGATKTPEVVVVSATGQTVYRGRIDDRYPKPGGKRREHPTTRDLRDALDDVVAGRPVRVPRTEAVGCDIDFEGEVMLTALLLIASAPTFHKDVARVLHARCAACHREGEAGPFPLLTYADARKRAKLIAQVVADKSMPPWKPDAGHGEFLDDRRLTAAEIDAITGWAAAGAPEGDAKDAPKPPAFKAGWQLGKPDIVLKMAKPFTVPAEGRDVYWHFVFPLNLKKEVYLRGIECRPGNRRVAHHAVGILDTSGTARRLDAKAKGEGYPGYGPGFIPAGFTPGYAPGQTPRFFDKDTSIVLKPGTDFVLQMHYHPIGKEQTDQTEIGLYLTDRRPPKGVVVVAMASEEIDIPAGEKAYRAKDRFKLPVELEVRSVWAHMHTIGKTVKVTATLPGGEVRKLLSISDWDFNWQDTYLYRKPFKLPRGTVIDAEWTWDNTADNPRNPFAPPRRIRQGEDSTDEMSGLIVGGVCNNWVDEIGHWAGVIGHYFEVAAKGAKFKRK